MENPVLAEVTRGHLVESEHRGAIAVVDADGHPRLVVGTIGRPVFPRSAVKVLQAIPLIETGAAEAFGFGDAELALACSSHSGELRHVRTAAAMLERAGLMADALECGAHAPIAEKAAVAIWAAGLAPSSLHNNCSGKHAGMLATARHLGEATAGYVAPGHPVQQRIAAVLTDFTGAPLEESQCGIDGCSVPTWAIPIAALAKAFAILAAGTSKAHGAAGRRLLAAGMAEPFMVAGSRRLDTEVMTLLRGRVFIKTGAEGVYCGAIPGTALGLALKIDDGAGRAAEMVLANVLGRLLPGTDAALAPFLAPETRNVCGIPSGRVQPAPALLRALDALT